MCGVTAILLSPLDSSALRDLCLSRSKIIRHRGPDWNGVRLVNWGGSRLHALAHERLSIVDPTSGKQPLMDPDMKCVAVVNGEIYNYRDLHAKLDANEVERFATQSDCQVIPSMFKKFGPSFVSMLDGDFALIVASTQTGEFLAARDPIGISPLYMGHASNGSIWFSSEMKAIQNDCVRVREFPPGHYFYFNFQNGCGDLVRYFSPSWLVANPTIPTAPCDLAQFRTAFEAAVSKRMMCDVPFGLILYGGVDSAIIAAIICKLFRESLSEREFWTQKVHSFSIGLKGCDDMKFARIISEHVGTKHHEFTFEVQEAVDALSDLIYSIESYDVMTVRASLLNYFLFRLIKSLGVKMVLTGEGAADLFGCRRDGKNETDPAKLHRNIVQRVAEIHHSDSLRANKASMSWGVETRVPILDVDFINYVMSIDPREKLVKEGRLPKQIFRDAYKDYLPPCIVNRLRVDHADGVSNQWIEGLKAHAESRITDLMMLNAEILFPYNTPKTKEAYLYRSIFSSHFPDKSAAKTVYDGCGPASYLKTDVLSTEMHPSYSRNVE